MSLPAIPGIEQIGKPVVSKTRDRPETGQAKQPAEPGMARRRKPDRARAIRPDIQSPIRIDGVQPATNVLNISAEPGKCLRLEIDIAEFDRACPGGPLQRRALPFD